MRRHTLAETHPDQERHPALDTFERVMTSGVFVDGGPFDQHRAMWFDVSVAGRDLLALAPERSSEPLRRSAPSETSSEE